MEAMAKHKAMNAVSSGSENRPKRFIDDNGFLHVFLRFMRTGTLDYSPGTFPDGVPPDAVSVDGKVTVLIEPGDLKEPDSLASLAGMPGLRKHEWATPEGELDIIGSVAGTPGFDGEFVECEAVITDAETIRRLQDGELIEVSAAYHHDVLWEPGEHEGKPYAGKQKNIRYNHFVLLPEGEGRAGRDVKAINSKENDVAETSEKKPGGVMVWLRKLGKSVMAMNEKDAEEIAKADAEGVEAKNEDPEPNPAPAPAASGEGAGPEGIKNLAKLLDELTKVKARAAELEGQLTSAQEKINELLSADKVEAEADAMATERDEAAEVMSENGIPKDKAMNSIKEGKLRGHALRVHAMNSIRDHQGKPKLDTAKIKDESFVLGMWNGVKENSGKKTSVVGGFTSSAQAMNAVQNHRQEALAALGFPAAKK